MPRNASGSPVCEGAARYSMLGDIDVVAWLDAVEVRQALDVSGDGAAVTIRHRDRGCVSVDRFHGDPFSLLMRQGQARKRRRAFCR